MQRRYETLNLIRLLLLLLLLSARSTTIYNKDEDKKELFKFKSIEKLKSLSFNIILKDLNNKEDLNDKKNLNNKENLYDEEDLNNKKDTQL